MEEFSSSVIEKGGGAFPFSDEWVCEAFGVLFYGFSVASTSWLIDVGEVEGEETVNDIVVIFCEELFNSVCEEGHWDSFFWDVFTEQMDIFYACGA